MRHRSTRKGRKYAAIPNAAMRDQNLTIEARGLLALLMTYADDWVFRKDHLVSITGMGKTKFSRVMKELIDRGYVDLNAVRNSAGHLVGRQWFINDDTEVTETCVSVSTEVTDNRSHGNPNFGKQGPIRRPTDKEDQKVRNPLPLEGDLFLEKEITENSQEDRESEFIETSFNEFWNDIWPSHNRKSGKADCRNVYFSAVLGKHKKAEKISPATLNRAATAYIASVDDIQFLKGPLPWLRQPGWEPFITANAPVDKDQARYRAIAASGVSG